MRTRYYFLLLLAVLLLPSCQPEPRVAYLVPDASMPGQKADASEAVYKDMAVSASARQVRKGEADGFLGSLLEKDFTVISMRIENRSSARAIYKPNYTALVNTVDYLKPLDYTDLYEFGGEAVDGLKGAFFDLDEAIPPGDSATGLLIFMPLSRDARKAALEVREYYVGTESISFTLPFKLKDGPL